MCVGGGRRRVLGLGFGRFGHSGFDFDFDFGLDSGFGFEVGFGFR